MRQHNKYLEKVYEEMDVYRQHLLRGDELTITQEETFVKMDICRGWLKEGYSDTEVIRMLKNHPVAKVQERRAREVAENCVEFIKEHEEYSKDDNGKIPKVNDHLINAFQYGVGSLGLNLDENEEPKPEQKEERRYFTFEQDFNKSESLEEFE